MSSSQSSEQHALNVEFEYPAPLLLLERGLHSVREGRYAEGAVYFTLAREQLDGDHTSLAAVLDAFTQGHLIYWNAQQGLLEASKLFVQVDTEQHARIATLETLRVQGCSGEIAWRGPTPHKKSKPSLSSSSERAIERRSAPFTLASRNCSE